MTVWDAGLQPERTLLAWRRTTLAFALGSALAVRLTAESAGVASVAFGILGVVFALVAFGVASRRYRLADRSLRESGELRTGAAPLLLAVLAAVAVGLAGVGYVIAAILAEVAG